MGFVLNIEKAVASKSGSSLPFTLCGINFCPICVLKLLGKTELQLMATKERWDVSVATQASPRGHRETDFQWICPVCGT